MSRRQMISSDDSLELLLDTICNTFGAVIFISILASILAQNSAPESASPEETSAAIEETYTLSESFLNFDGVSRQWNHNCLSRQN